MEPDSVELVSRLRSSLHELNNALTPVLANAQLAGLLLDPEASDVREAVDDVVEAARRANALVAEMREIAGALHDSLGRGRRDEDEEDDG